MNQIHEAYEKIQLNRQDKERIFNQLLEEKTVKKRMTPYVITFATCCLLFILTIPYIVHSSQNEPTIPTIQEQQENTYEVFADDYQGTIDHKEAIVQFIQDYQNGNKATLIITRSTREGDPIITTVQYSQNTITILEDSTKDRFGESPSIQKFQYKHLGRFNGDLYAYNDDLSLEAFDNGEAYYIISLRDYTE